MLTSKRTTLQTVVDAATPDPESLRPKSLVRGVLSGIGQIVLIAGAASSLAAVIAFVASRRAEVRNYPAPVPDSGH